MSHRLRLKGAEVKNRHLLHYALVSNGEGIIFLGLGHATKQQSLIPRASQDSPVLVFPWWKQCDSCQCKQNVDAETAKGSGQVPGRHACQNRTALLMSLKLPPANRLNVCDLRMTWLHMAVHPPKEGLVSARSSACAASAQLALGASVPPLGILGPTFKGLHG